MIKYFTLLLFICLPSFADDIMILTEPAYPYTYKENGQFMGIFTDIAIESLKSAKLSYSIEELPWARTKKMLKSSADILVPFMTRTESRENEYHWIGPVAERSIYAYKLKKNKNIKIENISDLKKYTIGVVRNSALHDQLKKLNLSKNLYLTSNDDNNINKIMKNRIDIFISLESRIKIAMKKIHLDYNLLQKLIKVPPNYFYYIAISRMTEKDKVKIIRKEFNRIKKSQKYKKIFDKYLK